MNSYGGKLVVFFSRRADVCGFVEIASLSFKGRKTCHDIGKKIDFQSPYRLWYSLLSDSCLDRFFWV